MSEQEDIATAIKKAMKDIEKYKPELADCLPKDDYVQLVKKGNVILFDLLRAFADIPHDASGDILGKIYEFFLAKFALAEGQGGGEFYTPTSVVNIDGRNHRTTQRHGVRSCMRFWRYVCSVTKICSRPS